MHTFKTSFFISGIILLTHCASSGRVVEKKSNGAFQPDHGPFDAKGNYIESWADNPPKRIYKRSSYRRKRASSSKPSTPTPIKKSYRKAKSTPTYKKPNTYRTPIKTRKKTTKKRITTKMKRPIVHTVRKGDTVYGLARKFRTSPSSIIKANRIKKGIIKIGQKLIIPRK